MNNVNKNNNGFIRKVLLPFLPVVIVMVFSITLNLFSSIRLDEAQSVWAATKSVPAILKFIAQDVHPPLYLILLHFWIQVFGTSLFALRSLSIVFFLLAMPFVYLLARQTASTKVARITLILFCLSPFLIWYSTETRMYTMLAFFSALSSWRFLKFCNTRDGKDSFWYGVVSIFGMYTHYFFAILVFLQTIYFLGVLWSDRENKQKMIGGIVLLGLSLVSVGLSFLPWVVYVILNGSGSNSRPLLVLPTSYNVLLTFVHFFSGFQTPSIQNALISLWPLVVLILFLTFSRKRRHASPHTFYYILVTFGSIFLAFVISYTVQPVLVSRYLIFVTPTLFYLIALLLDYFNKALFALVIGVIFLSNFVFQYQQSISPNILERENYSAATIYVTKASTDQDIVVVTAPFTIYPIEYYYKGEAQIETIPEWSRYVSGSIPPFSEDKLAEQIEKYQKRYQRMFVVLSYNQGYQDRILSYLDAHLKLNSSQTFSPQLQVREYQLRYE